MNLVNTFGRINIISQFLAVSHGPMAQQTRNTFVLKRRNPPPLYRKGSRPARMRSRHFIYDLVEDREVRARSPINLILTSYVENVGDRGDRISMGSISAYNRLLLPGLATYDTPQNAAKYGADDPNRQKTKFTSPYVPRTLKTLRESILSVTMSYDNPWTLEKWHVRNSFRKAGIHLSDDTITMSEHEIKGPNLDLQNKEFYVTVTINNTEKTPVRCRIYHYSNNANAQKNIAYSDELLKEISDPIFPEDKPVLDSLPIPLPIQAEIKRKALEAGLI